MRNYKVCLGLLLLSAMFAGCAKVQYQKIGTSYYQIVCNRRVKPCENKIDELCPGMNHEIILADSFKKKRMLIIDGRKYFTTKKNHELKVVCKDK